MTTLSIQLLPFPFLLWSFHYDEFELLIKSDLPNFKSVFEMLLKYILHITHSNFLCFVQGSDVYIEICTYFVFGK